MEAFKYDGGKLRMDLLWPRAVQAVVAVFTYGAAKYGERNWDQGMNYSRLYSATLRHLFAWWGGEDDDPESNLSHLSHAASNLLALIHYMQQGIGTDDRK